MLSELSEDVVTTTEINELENFGDKYSAHKTPTKKSNLNGAFLLLKHNVNGRVRKRMFCQEKRVSI